MGTGKRIIAVAAAAFGILAATAPAALACTHADPPAARCIPTYYRSCPLTYYRS